MSEVLYIWVFNTGSKENATEAKVSLNHSRGYFLKTRAFSENHQDTFGDDYYDMRIVYQCIAVRSSFRGVLSSPKSDFCN